MPVKPKKRKPKQKLGPNQEKWIRDLETTKTRQGSWFLERNGLFCCLGRACKVFRLKRTVAVTCNGKFGQYGPSKERKLAPDSVVEKLALRGNVGRFSERALKGKGALASANDSGATFAEIAAFCRKYPEAVFTEPR